MELNHTPVGNDAAKSGPGQWLALLAAVVALGSTGCTSKAHASGEAPSVLVRTTPVREGSLPQIVTAYGTVQANSADRDAVSVTLPARVETVYVRVGQSVRKGAPLLRLAPTPQSQAAYAQAVSALHVASDLVSRTRELFREHLATRQQLSSAETGRADARSSLDALVAQGAAGRTTIRAPFPGIVTAISTSVHAVASVGAVLLELVRPEALVLDVGVEPNEASQIRPGDAVSVRAIGSKRALRAVVSMRGAVVDAATGLVPVEISLPPGALLPGQWAEGHITVGRVHGYVVPHEAILVDSSGSTYVVQVHQGIAKIVHVRVLAALGARDTVSGPLDGGAPVVLAGNYQLSDGMRVRRANSPAPKAKDSK